MRLYALGKDIPQNCEDCPCHKFVTTFIGDNMVNEVKTLCRCILDGHEDLTFKLTKQDCPIIPIERIIDQIKENKESK